jgi:aryl-alcohol dehydrogenase-like predicted oxidoreductase
MIKHLAIPNSPLHLSILALGNGPFGNGFTSDTERLYAQYREAGGNTFDTAHCYSFWLPAGSGASERALGECIREFNDRNNVVIVTKGGHPAVLPDYPRPDFFLSSQVIASDIDESLDRLGVDTIDLYLLHRDDSRVSVDGIIHAMNSHITAGRIKCFGASNWTTARIAEANAYATSKNLQGFVISQPQFSLAQINAEEPTTDPNNRYLYDHDIAWHAETQFPAMCYSPTAGGYFGTDGNRAKSIFGNSISIARLARAKELAKQLHATPTQIALAYLLAQPFPVVPILGTADSSHLAECVGSIRLELTPAQTTWLRDG